MARHQSTNRGSPVLPRTGEQVLVDFFKLISESNGDATSALARDIIVGMTTVKEENERLKAEVVKLERESAERETKHVHTNTELIKLYKGLTDEEIEKREKLEARLLQTEKALEKEQEASAKTGRTNAELKQQIEGLAAQRQDEKQMLAKAEGKISQLEANKRMLEESQETQRDNLKSRGQTISQLKSKFKDAETEAAKLRQDLGRVTGRLQQIEGFSQTLTIDDNTAEYLPLRRLKAHHLADSVFQLCTIQYLVAGLPSRCDDLLPRKTYPGRFSE